MARFDRSGAAGRLARAAAPGTWKDKAKRAAATLKAEYEAGKRGDDAPAAKIWGTPKEQLDAMLRLIRDAPATATTAATAATAPTSAGTGTDAEAAEVADVLRGVDWASVRAATSEKGSEVAAAMRSMADHVDWSKVQPVAAQVSSAVIAAVASGRIGVGGPLGATLARTIIGQSDLAGRVGRQMQRDEAAQGPELAPDLLPDFRGAIEATAREA